jgi:hypothetical protein
MIISEVSTKQVRRYTHILKGSFVKRVLFGSIIILLLSIFMDVRVLLFLLVAIIFNSQLYAFQLSKGLPSDLELSTFSTVLITVTFGIKWGILAAVLTKLIACIYSGSVLVDHIFMILTYINAALIAALFSGANIITLGLVIVVINCILMYFISKFFLSLDFTVNLCYTGTNLIFNIIVFLILAEPVRNLLLMRIGI